MVAMHAHIQMMHGVAHAAAEDLAQKMFTMHTAWSPPRGPLACPQDRLIGKKVFKIRGTIPAGNYMQLPKKRSRTLGLTGRFVYIQVRWVHHAHGR